jgi:hypothetical protein
MASIQQSIDGLETAYEDPPCVARYRPIFWEPVAGTGERVVALIAIEPHESTQWVIAAKTYCVLTPSRLVALVGRRRGSASKGVLQQVADYISLQQAAGMPLTDIAPPFHGFVVAPQMTCRGYDVDQVLNAAVRSVSAFANADAMTEEEAATETPRSTVRTSEFIKTMKRYVAADSAEVRARFDKRFRPHDSQLDLTIDYAFSRWIVQVTSLPATERQSHNAMREAQSKLFEIGLLRQVVDGNSLWPILLVNEDVLFHSPSDQALAHATMMQSRLHELARIENVKMLQVATPEEGADRVRALT